MNMLIVTGLIAFGFLAFIAAVFMAIGEDKASTTKTLTSIGDATTIITPSVELAAPLISDLIAERRSPAIEEEVHTTIVTSQFRELSTQLYALREQTREIERRLSILSEIAEAIEHDQLSIDSEDYHQSELANSARS